MTFLNLLKLQEKHLPGLTVRSPLVKVSFLVPQKESHQYFTSISSHPSPSLLETDNPKARPIVIDFMQVWCARINKILLVHEYTEVIKVRLQNSLL